MRHCVVFANHQLVKLRTEQNINAYVSKMTIEEK
jgi:hypothetical protein